MKKYVKELKELENEFLKELQSVYKAEALVRSAIENTNLSKEELHNSTAYQELINKKGKNEKTYKKGSNKKEEKATAEKKPKTKEISYGLFLKGKSVPEIAKERSLAVSTIESHLAYFVKEGSITAEELVNADKISQILETSKKLETTKLKPIKEELGDDYSYSELRFVINAYFGQLSKEENN